MNSVRTGHTATLLNDGRVLVAGGFDSSNASLSTAELFDPTTGEFTLANGPMTAGRADHTATLLSSGKVLVVGGSPNTALGEIFDPASNTFTSTTTKGTEVIFLTATLLVNGRVLVAGGLVNFVNINHCFSLYPPLSVASASIFDNGSASFLATGDMSSPRAEHTATVLGDGKVLVAGGSDFRARFSSCAPGGGQTIPVLASAELYDPVHGAFALTSSMITARSRHTATLLANGDVVVIGGIDAGPAGAYFLASAELYH
jgi:Galactose oxidase, central domain